MTSELEIAWLTWARGIARQSPEALSAAYTAGYNAVLDAKGDDMGRRRTRPPRERTYGVARGWRQREILAALLAGESLGVLTHHGDVAPSPPGGITLGAWVAFQKRLKDAGFALVWEKESFGRWRYVLAADDRSAVPSENGQQTSFLGGEN